MFLSGFWPPLTYSAPPRELCAFLWSANFWRRRSARDAGRAGSTAGSVSASTSRFTPTAESTEAMSPISWVSHAMLAAAESETRLTRPAPMARARPFLCVEVRRWTVLEGSRSEHFRWVRESVRVAWLNSARPGKCLSRGHLVGEPCVWWWQVGLFVEVTGAAVRQQDVLLECQSELLSWQHCGEKPMLSKTTDICEAAELCDFGRF